MSHVDCVLNALKKVSSILTAQTDVSLSETETQNPHLEVCAQYFLNKASRHARTVACSGAVLFCCTAFTRFPYIHRWVFEGGAPRCIQHQSHPIRGRTLPSISWKMLTRRVLGVHFSAL